MAPQNSRSSFILFPTPGGMGAALCARASHASPCFAGWIISLIVLIVPRSDVINPLLIPSHVPRPAAPLGLVPFAPHSDPPQEVTSELFLSLGLAGIEVGISLDPFEGFID